METEANNETDQLYRRFGWRRTSIEPPPQNAYVLALIMPMSPKPERWGKNLLILHYKKKSFRFASDLGRVFSRKDLVKYWMPLPGPPSPEPYVEMFTVGSPKL